MKRIIAAFIAFIFLSSAAFASVGFKINGSNVGAATDLNMLNTSSTSSTFFDGSTYSIPALDPNLFAAGTGNGGGVSQASSVAALNASATYIRKVIPSNGDAAFTAGTLANGKPGQYLTVFVAGLSPTGATTGGNYTISPTTCTGFSSIKLTAVKDFVTFLYVDDTTGWTIVNYGGTVTITLKT